MQSPSTGVAIILMYHHKVLIGERIQNHKNYWQLPGGFIELGEAPHPSIIRETLEEINLVFQNESCVAITNNIFCTSKHSILLIFKAKCTNPTKLILKEHSKCTQWYWESWDKLSSTFIFTIKNSC